MKILIKKLKGLLESESDPSKDQSVGLVEVAYRLDVNEFRGRRSVQLMVEQLVAV